MNLRMVIIGLLLATTASIAQEGSMCQYYIDAVSRGVNNIQQQGSNLSSMAKKKLYEDLRFGTEQCLSNCEGQHFNFCNDIAKKIESK